MYQSTQKTTSTVHRLAGWQKSSFRALGLWGLLFACCSLFWPALVQAQTITMEGTAITTVYGQSDCKNNTTLTFTFKFTPTTTALPNTAATPATFKVYLGSKDTQTGVLLATGDLTLPSANTGTGGVVSTEITGTFNGSVPSGNEDVNKGMTADGKLTVRDLIGYQYVLNNPGKAPNENTLCDLAPASSSTGEQSVEVYVVAEYFTANTVTPGATQKETADGNSPIKYDLTPPVAPAEPTLEPSESSITVNWTLQTGFKYDLYYSSKEFTSDNAATTAILYTDCKKTTSASCQVKGLKNGTTYYFAIRAYDAADNIGPFSKVTSGSPIELTDFFEAYRSAGGKDAGFSGGYCFLATAAFGTYDNRYVQILRDFRDKVLMPYAPGRSFVAWYYNHSPGWAAWLRQSPVAQTAMKVALLPLIAFAALFVRIPFWVTLLGLLMLFVVIRQFRRSRRLAVAAVTALTLLGGVALAPGQAQAQDDQNKQTKKQVNYFEGSSPRSFGVELRFGPYFPSIDSETGLTGKPYDTVFNSATMLSIGATFEWLFFKKVGSLGLYGGASIAWTSAQARQGTVSSGLTARSSGLTINQTTDTTDDTTDTSSQDTTLWVLPLQLGLSYRFDYLTQRYGFPIVPYIRGGLDYYLWWVTAPPDGSLAFTTNADGNKENAIGGRLGAHFAVGLQFLLDVMDRRTAKNFDLEFGVNHSYIFVEWQLSVVGIASEGLNLSDSSLGTGTIRAGLMFQF